MTLSTSPTTSEWAHLRSRFKEIQQDTGGVFQNWQIRVHRSLSWFKRALELPDGDQDDVKFMLLWVSLNALYSRWDAERNAPAHDGFARQQFIVRVCELGPIAVRDVLQRQRPYLKKLLANCYLSNTFWRNPDSPDAKARAVEDASYYDRNMKAKDYGRLLGQVMDRLYVMRGQLMHGAATGGGSLNRETLKYCLQIMQTFVPLIIGVVIDGGANDDWPELCYPPLKDARPSGGGT